MTIESDNSPTEWTPIPFDELYDQVISTENELQGEEAGFWQLIKIIPEKWTHQDYQSENDTFWVVAICGNKVIWYNDIEEGFDVAEYHKHGEIISHGGQRYLKDVIMALLASIRRI